MSCTLSSTETPANYENAECFRIVFSHSSIASLILRRLSTAKVSKQTTEETLADVQDLDQRLRAWFESIPSCYRGGSPSKSARNPRAMSDIQSRYIFFIHRHSLINIHSQFCHPWNRPAVDQSENPQVLAQRQASMNIVASAARELILARMGCRYQHPHPSGKPLLQKYK